MSCMLIMLTLALWLAMLYCLLSRRQQFAIPGDILEGTRALPLPKAQHVSLTKPLHWSLSTLRRIRSLCVADAQAGRRLDLRWQQLRVRAIHEQRQGAGVLLAASRSMSPACEEPLHRLTGASFLQISREMGNTIECPNLFMSGSLRPLSSSTGRT